MASKEDKYKIIRKIVNESEVYVPKAHRNSVDELKRVSSLFKHLESKENKYKDLEYGAQVYFTLIEGGDGNKRIEKYEAIKNKKETTNGK